MLNKNSAVDHQSLATWIHRLIEADHLAPPPPPGQIPADLEFGRQLIGFEQEQLARVQLAHIQLHLTTLGFNVGPIDGILGRKTTQSIMAFQKSQQLKEDGKSSAQLLEKLKFAVEDMARPGPSQRGQTELQRAR